MPLLSQTEREQVLVEICAAICTMLKLLDGPEDDDGLQFTQTVLHLLARAQAVRDSLQPPQLGRGCADLTLPPLAAEKRDVRVSRDATRTVRGARPLHPWRI